MNNNYCCNSMQQRSAVNCNPVISALPLNPTVTMAYVPFQQWAEVYPCEKGLSAGTIFPVLDKPFRMGCC